MAKNIEIPFVALPVDIFGAIKEQLDALGVGAKADDFLRGLGAACGKSVVRRTGFKWETDEQLSDALQSMWAEIGIGRLVAKDVSSGGVAAEVTDTVESEAIGVVGEPSCHFTAGYIAGVVSELAGKEHISVEEQCVCEGHTKCVFNVVPV
jgi:predicted hydrocarbon binding protein